MRKAFYHFILWVYTNVESFDAYGRGQTIKRQIILNLQKLSSSFRRGLLFHSQLKRHCKNICYCFLRDENPPALPIPETISGIARFKLKFYFQMFLANIMCSLPLFDSFLTNRLCNIYFEISIFRLK